MNSNVLSPLPPSSSSQTRPSTFTLKLMLQHMQLVLYSLNSVMMGSGDPLALSQRAFQIQSALSDTERNYAIYDKELLSVIHGLEEWCHILEGTKYKIKILNDHQNLTYFRSAQNLNRCQAHWSLYLSRFDFELIHCPGRHSAKPDALSRQVDHKQGEEDNQNQTLLQPDMFHVNATGAQLIN